MLYQKLFIALAACLLLSQVVESGRVSRHQGGALNKGLSFRGLGLSQDDPQPEAQWFDQRVDHYDPTNNSTFKQLYYVNDTFWSGAASSGPIFIMLGGEGPVTPAYVLDHFVLTQYAAKFGALVVAVEHRFYGQSMPASDLSTKNLRLLSTPQALADYADFVRFINTQYNITDSKWISFGGSYSGSLSAWFRMKYPHLISGSIATSAPVQAQLNFPEYFEVVQRSLGPQCAARVNRATQLVTNLLQSDSGRQELQKLFSTCQPISTSALDIATFMSSLTDGICDIVQYNNDNNKYIPFNIEKVCEIITGTTDQEIMASFVNFTNIYNAFTGENCTEASYSDMITDMQQTDPTSDAAAARSWTWQTCTEYGYFQTGDADDQPFSKTITLDWFLQQCNDIFGYPFTPDIDGTNDIYGAKNLKETRVVLGNGLIDPWHILGITNNAICDQESELVRVMSSTAHCADLYPPAPTDPAELTLTRAVEVEMINYWLSESC